MIYENILLGQPLNGFDKQVGQSKFEPVFQPNLLKNTFVINFDFD